MQVAELFAKLGLQVDKKSWSVGNDVIAGLGKALVAWAGFKAVQGIAGWITDTIAWGDAAVKTAQKLGITAEAVQELGYVAGQSGTSGEALTAALARLSAGMSDVAKTGKGPTADGLRAIGLSMKDLKGETLDQNLEAIAGAFAKMPDGAKKTAAAMDLFGKSGRDLIPLLNSGQEGIVALRKEAVELGIVMSGKDGKEFESFGDDIDRVKMSLVGLRNQAIIALLPTLREMVTNLLAWVKANREMIKSKIVSVVKGLAEILIVLGKAIAFVVEHWEIFAAALIGTAVVTGLMRLIKLIQFLQMASTAAAAKTALAWLVAAAPFVLIGAAIAAVALLIIKYKKQAREVFNWIAGQLVRFVDWITSLPGRAINALVSLGNLIKTKIGEAWDWVKKKAEEAWDYIVGIPGRIKDWALGKVGIGGGGTGMVPDMSGFAPATPGSASYLVPRKGGPPVVTITNGPMTVTVPPGGKPEDYEAAVRKGVQDEWANQMNHALADAGEDN